MPSTPQPATADSVKRAVLADAKRRAYILADNRLAETGGGWDLNLLQKEAEEIAFESMEHFSRECLYLDELLGDGITEEQQNALTPVIRSRDREIHEKEMPNPLREDRVDYLARLAWIKRRR